MYEDIRRFFDVQEALLDLRQNGFQLIMIRARAGYGLGGWKEIQAINKNTRRENIQLDVQDISRNSWIICY